MYQSTPNRNTGSVYSGYAPSNAAKSYYNSTINYSGGPTSDYGYSRITGKTMVLAGWNYEIIKDAKRPQKRPQKGRKKDVKRTQKGRKKTQKGRKRK